MFNVSSIYHLASKMSWLLNCFVAEPSRLFFHCFPFVFVPLFVSLLLAFVYSFGVPTVDRINFLSIIVHVWLPNRKRVFWAGFDCILALLARLEGPFGSCGLSALSVLLLSGGAVTTMC